MDYISLGITGIMGLFLIFGFLFGLKRGVKRTLVRSIWIFLVLLVVFLISTHITDILLGFKINIVIDGQKFATIEAYVVHLLKENIVVDGGNYEAIAGVIMGVITLIINIILFVILYWVLKLVSILFYWIFNIFIFRKERKAKKRARKEKTKIRIKKYRLAGAAVGIILGFVSFCVTLTPIVGYVNIAKTVDGRTKSETEEGIITDLGGDTYSKIIEEYDGSVAIKIMDTLSVDKAITGVFNNVTTTKINGEKVKLYDEALVAADAYNIIKEMNVTDIDNISNEEFGKLLDNAEELTNKIFESKLITTSSDQIIPFVAKYVRQNIDTSNFKTYSLNFYNAFFDQFEGYNSVKTKEEVVNAIGLIRTLNNNNLFLPIIQNKTGDMALYLQQNLTKPASDEIVESLFKLNTVKNMAPAVVNFMLGYGAEELGYEYEEENQVLASTLQSCSTNILHSVVDLLSTYDSGLTTKVKLNEISVGALGRIFDEIKVLVSSNNFKSIMSSVEPDLEKIALETLNSQPQFLKNSVTKAINNISEITNFENTFVDLYKAYDIVKSEFDKAKIDDKYDVELMNFAKMGQALNTFQNSDLLRDHLFLDTLKNAISHYLDEAESRVEGDKAFKFTFDKIVYDNIEELKLKGVNWVIELPVYKNIACIVTNLLQDADNIEKTIKSEEDDSVEKIGYELEHNLKTSALLKNADRLLVSDLLDLADIKFNTAEDVDTKENMSTLLMDAKNNVNTVEVLNWEHEFKHIKEIIKENYDDTSDANIMRIANMIDNVVFDKPVLVKSKIFTQDMFNNFISNYMDNIFGEVEETDDFYSTSQRIKNSFNETITSYNNEFGSLLELKKVKTLSEEDDFDFKMDAVLMGCHIDDSLSYGVDENNPIDNKVVVNKSLINEYIVKKIDSYFSDYSSELDKEIKTIKSRITDEIRYYQVEFSALSRLMDVSDEAGRSDFDFKVSLDAKRLGAKIDLSLAPTNINEVNEYSIVVDKSLINGYIKRVITDEVNIGPSSEFSDVIETIIGSNNGVDADGYVIYGTGRIDTFSNTYANEFGYLSRLVVVSDSFSSVTIDNIDEKNIQTNTTLAEEFDGGLLIVNPLKESQLVGDSLLQVIGSSLEDYKNDNSEYNDILVEVNKNYIVIKSEVNWVYNVGGTKTYTQVIDALSEIYDTLESSVTNDIANIMDVNTFADNYNGTLATIQENILFSVNGTNRLAYYIMNKVAEKLQESITVLTPFNNAIEYVDNYMDYLDYCLNNNINSAQPYADNTLKNAYVINGIWTFTKPTEGEFDEIQVNKPFTVVGGYIVNGQ